MLIVDELSFAGHLDLPEAALLLAGEGMRPWQAFTGVQSSM
jgi:hypothetical protein